MASREEYELAYNLYSANKTFEATQASLELRSLTESSEIIEEAVKDNVKAYIKKVIDGIQKVWTKFKDNVEKAKLKWSVEDMQKAINTYPVKVNVSPYYDYDPSVLQNINLVEFNWGTMEGSLGTKEEFMKKYYGATFYNDEAKSIVDNIRKKTIKNTTEKYALTKDDLQKMLDYMKTHKDFLDKVSKDLDNVNKSSRSAETTAGMASGTTYNPVNASTITRDYLDYYLEADDQPKVTSSDDSTGGSSGNDDQKKADDEKQKKIQVYFKCISEILSAEMTISREIYKFYATCIGMHMKNYRGGNKKQGEQPKQGEAKTADNNGPAQVDTSV